MKLADPHSNDFSLLPGLIRRDIAGRFAAGQNGWLWLVVTPLLLLAVYGFVFGVIFRARVPDGLEMPFVAWLAVALWPWLAFSEGVLRGSQAIVQHAGLISKVALRRELLVISSVTAVFILHLGGYLVVLVALHLLGVDIFWSGLLTVVLTLVTLYVLTLGLAMLAAAVQVFLRDLEQALPTLMMLWFFLTPILYAPEMLPDELKPWLGLNPMTWWMEQIRAALLWGEILPGLSFLWMVMGAVLMFWVGMVVFRRLSPHFEDFL